MINIKNQIPSVYYDASRDFQILGHLFEVVLNYSKTNADMLYLLPNGIKADTRATELLAFTLGFKLRRNYDKEQLAALVSIFPRLLKMKGTLQAVILAGHALVKASGIPGTFESKLEDHILTIKIPQELSDITLLLDLLPYIIPFGIRVSIVRTTVLRSTLSTSLNTTSVVRRLPIADDMDNTMPRGRHPLGLVQISESGNVILNYSNRENREVDTLVPTIGLLATSPVITLNLNNNPSVEQADKEEN